MPTMPASFSRSPSSSDAVSAAACARTASRGHVTSGVSFARANASARSSSRASCSRWLMTQHGASVIHRASSRQSASVSTLMCCASSAGTGLLAVVSLIRLRMDTSTARA
eukprot:4828511-Prymnesium_polylepis.1